MSGVQVLHGAFDVPYLQSLVSGHGVGSTARWCGQGSGIRRPRLGSCPGDPRQIRRSRCRSKRPRPWIHCPWQSGPPDRTRRFPPLNTWAPLITFEARHWRAFLLLSSCQFARLALFSGECVDGGQGDNGYFWGRRSDTAGALKSQTARALRALKGL